jgi:HPt (histidine-containing phosphotransfer) domain-containing protein
VPEVLDGAALQSLLEMVGDDPGFVGELVDEFLADAPVQLAAMRAAVDLGSAAELVRPAHTLKGTSANIGAALLAAECRAIEESAKSGVIEGASARIDAAEVALSVATEALARARARDWQP